MTADAQAPGHFTFAHGIVRDAIREALPEQRRGAVHEAVASALVVRRDAGADVPAAQIAHHALAAARAGADPQPAWEAALEAAREAGAALGHAEAAAHYAEALEARRAGRRGAGRRAPRRDAAARRRHDLRRRHRGTRAAATRRPRPPRAATATRDTLARAALGFAQVRPYGAVDEESVTLLSQALERLADGPLKVRVTGLLSVFGPDQARREALIDEALATAGDEATRAWLWPSAVIVNWRPERSAQRAEASEEAMRVALQHADHGALVWTHLQRVRDAMQAGDVARATADLDRARPVANATRRSFSRWMLLLAEAAYAAFDGRLDESDRMTEEALVLNRATATTASTSTRSGGSCWRGCAGARRTPTRPSCAASRPATRTCRPGRRCWRRSSGSSATSRPRRRGVALCARDDFAAVTRSPDFLAAAVCLAEAAAGAGEPWQVERLYELLAPYADANPVLEHVWAIWGPAARALGLLAAADDRPDDAAAHFAAAVRLARAWGAPGWELRSIGDWLATGVPVADRGELVGRGLTLARELALPGVAARIADEAQTITP